MYKCEYCGIEFEKSLDINSIRFCCDRHRKLFLAKNALIKRKLNGTHVCGYSLVANRKKAKAYNNWKCSICGENSKIFRTRRELQQHKKECHPEAHRNGNRFGLSFGVSPRKGKTKENDETIRKMSITLKEGYASGRLKSAAKGTHQSPERKAEISKFISERNEKLQGAGRKDVKWFTVSNLNGKEYTVRGTWELNVAKHLNELGILWERNRRLSYMLSNYCHTYNPDFFLPNTNEYIEVKGWFSEKDKIKMKCIKEQYPQTSIYFIDKNSYFDFVKGNISLEKEMLLNNISF